MEDKAPFGALRSVVTLPRKQFAAASAINNLEPRELITVTLSSAGVTKWKAPETTVTLETLTLVGGTGRYAGSSPAWYYIRIVYPDGSTDYDFTYRVGNAPADYCQMQSSQGGEVCYYHTQIPASSWNNELGGTTLAFGSFAYGGYSEGGSVVSKTQVPITPSQEYTLEVGNGAAGAGSISFTYWK